MGADSPVRRLAKRVLHPLLDERLYRYLQEHHAVPNNIAKAARVPKLDKRLPTHMEREQKAMVPGDAALQGVGERLR